MTQPQLTVRFITDKSLLGDLIRFDTHAPTQAPSHAEFELEDGSFLGAHADGGVQIRPANYTTPTYDRRYSLPCTPTQYNVANAFMRAQIGKPYDFTDIAGILLDKDWHSRDKWICSELVLATLEVSGFEPLNVLPNFTNRIDPDRLHLSPLFIGRMIYSGVSPKYPPTK